MECPKCSCEMEEYAVENPKVVYRDNGEETKVHMDKDIFLCPKCKIVVGTVR